MTNIKLQGDRVRAFRKRPLLINEVPFNASYTHSRELSLLSFQSALGTFPTTVITISKIKSVA